MEFRDYYTTLGVAKTATEAEIKRAYRKLARQHHPDLNPGDQQAEARFKEINEAYEVLGSPETRRKYDELGANWRQYEQAGAAGGPAGPGGPFGGGMGGGATYRTMTPEEMQELFGGADPFSDFFHTFFGARTQERRSTGARTRRRGRASAPAYPVDLTLDEAFAGASRRLALGMEKGARTIDIRLPAGVQDGARVRAPGPEGDVFLTVRILPHARFERRGQDLHTKVPVPLFTAVLGGEVTVTSLSGSALRIKVPESTAPGRVFRLRGHGMPAVGKPAERGDLYVTADVQMPASLSETERRHWEALRALAERP